MWRAVRRLTTLPRRAVHLGEKHVDNDCCTTQNQYRRSSHLHAIPVPVLIAGEQPTQYQRNRRRPTSDTTRGAEPTEVLRYWPSVARIADGVRSSGQGDSGYSPRLAPDSRVNSASHATHCASAAAECPTKTFIRWLRPCVPSSTRSTACSFT